ncbi:hypothetical protein E2C01_073055 [Portunus trituberculatus]|uniref:Uncharacterized protein n=1 Tax=Portunus trituberculatus TaxID=210409 RepID=A0A5B7I9J5_PORTR|nr:hypothetical protein [Portunus trituberculatus]
MPNYKRKCELLVHLSLALLYGRTGFNVGDVCRVGQREEGGEQGCKCPSSTLRDSWQVVDLEQRFISQASLQTFPQRDIVDLPLVLNMVDAASPSSIEQSNRRLAGIPPCV